MNHPMHAQEEAAALDMIRVAENLKAAREELAADNEAAERGARQENERALEKMLRSYVADKGTKFVYGGVCNLLQEVKSAVEDAYADCPEAADAVAFACAIIEAASDACDIQYTATSTAHQRHATRHNNLGRLAKDIARIKP